MQGQPERSSNSVLACIRKKPSVCFDYSYMALILKSFILVSQIWKKKKREKRKIYCVFHMISVVTITGLASSYSNGDGRLTVLSSL